MHNVDQYVRDYTCVQCVQNCQKKSKGEKKKRLDY